MRIVFWILLLFIAGLGVTFSILNAEPVTLNYYIGTRQVPLSLLLFGLLMSGVLFGLIFSLKMVISLKLKNKSLTRRLNNYEQELSKLRLLSPKDA